MPSTKRILPNILITGTPGVGKSTLAHQITEKTNLIWRDISKLAIENECLEEYDPVYQCPILDEDKLLDCMEEYMSKGGNVVDYHGADFFPKRWFDIIFVLQTDNTVLYDRLSARGYTGKKLEDNLQCEIFGTILEETQSSYSKKIIHTLPSNTLEDMEMHVDMIYKWIEQWKADNTI